MFSVFALILLSLIHHTKQWSTDTQPPSPPRITDVIGKPDGLHVRWEAFPTQPIIYQTIVYKDKLQREETTIIKSGNERQAVLPYVKPCGIYTVQISLANIFGSSKPSDPVDGQAASIDLPKPPQSLQLSSVVDGYLLSWTPPENSPHFSKYIMLGRAENDELVEQFVKYDQNSSVLRNFHLNRDYNLTMVTENSCGKSNESDQIHVEKILVPPMPYIADAISENQSIVLQFVRDDDKYRVDYYELAYTSPFVNVSYRVKELPDEIRFTKYIEPCFNHTFTVFASNPAGNSKTSVRHAMTLSEHVPKPPENITLTETNGDFFLKWDVESSTPILNHRVDYYDLRFSPFMEWAAGNSREVKMRRIRKCNAYNIRMRSENQCGWSQYSATLKASFPPYLTPDAITNLKILENSERVEIAWDAGDDSENRTQYDLLLLGSSGDLRNVWAPPDATHLVLSDLNPDEKYTLYIRAENHCGWSKAAKIML